MELSSRKTCWYPPTNTQQLWMWPYLETSIADITSKDEITAEDTSNMTGVLIERKEETHRKNAMQRQKHKVEWYIYKPRAAGHH